MLKENASNKTVLEGISESYTAVARHPLPQTRVGPRNQKSITAQLKEVWRYRDLVYNLVVRDLKVRYRHSVLGILWSMLNPLLMMGIFTFVFTVMMPNNDIAHFPVFVLAGLLPWNFFQGTVMGTATQVIANGHLIKKVYFPREVLTLSSVLSNLVNFMLGLIPLFAFLLLSGIGFSKYMLWVPLIILIQVALLLGLGFFFSTLSVFYRDTIMVLDVLLLGWFFLTPVFYPMELIQQQASLLGFELPVYRLVRWLNPMASIVDSYRAVLYGAANGAPPGPPALDFLLRTGVTALLVLLLGWWYFRRHSHQFGEEV